MCRVFFLLSVFLACFPIVVTAADIPNLIRPGEADEERASGFLRSLGSAAYRHGCGTVWEISPASHPPGAPFFSPDGRTVYVPGRGLAALDTRTGERRFEYRYSGYNMRVTDYDEDGITLQFYQGPHPQQYVRFEHGTGRELSRAKIPGGGKDAKFKAFRIFQNGKRYLLRSSIISPLPARDPSDKFPQPPPREPGVILYDAAEKRSLIELPSTGLIRSEVLTSNEKRLLVTSGEELTAVDTATGQKLWTMPLGLGGRHSNRTYPVVSQSGLTAYTWRLHKDEAQIVAVNIETGKVVDVLVRDERKNIFSSPVISPNENCLLTWSTIIRGSSAVTGKLSQPKITPRCMSSMFGRKRQRPVFRRTASHSGCGVPWDWLALISRAEASSRCRVSHCRHHTA